MRSGQKLGRLVGAASHRNPSEIGQVRLLPHNGLALAGRRPMINYVRSPIAVTTVAVVLAACQAAASPSSFPTRSTTPSAPSTTTPTASSANAAPQIVWTAEPFEGAVHAVAVDAATVVAVGATADGPAAWTSPDGVTWQRHAVPPPAILEEYEQGVPGEDAALNLQLVLMGPLARLGDTLFSFGTFAGDNDFFRPLGWRSADGSVWVSIESENVFFDQCCSIVQLVAGDPGLLAVKHNFPEYSGELWLWTAATSWVLTWPTSPQGTDRPQGAEILDAVWADGKYVAVGMATTNEAPTTAGLQTMASSWVSPDGQAWQAAPDSGDRAGSVMESVSQLAGGGFVAVGCDGCQPGGFGRPASWVSADGLGWTRVALPATFEGTAYRVLQVDGGLLAIGAAPDGTPTWTSADGLSWEPGPILAFASQGPRTSVEGQRHNVTARGGEVLFLVYRGRDETGTLLDSVLMRGAIQN